MLSSKSWLYLGAGGLPDLRTPVGHTGPQENSSCKQHALHHRMAAHVDGAKTGSRFSPLLRSSFERIWRGNGTFWLPYFYRSFPFCLFCEITSHLRVSRI